MAEYQRALVVYAHPDDAEFLAGGTIASWTRGGTEVHYVCATDGSAGWNGPGKSREEIAAMREPEQRAAADVLGVASVTFLGYQDGSLAPTLELRKAVCREVRRVRPDVIVTFDPSQLWTRRGYINHPDHRAAGQATLDVVACDAPTRPQFPELIDEGFEPFEVPELWLATGPGKADRFVDIGETIDLKIKALGAHESQLENMGESDIEGRMRKWASEIGARVGFAAAECFKTFRFDEDR